MLVSLHSLASLQKQRSHWRLNRKDFLVVHPENRLKDSASPYLRSAAHQPIDWYEWGDAAFERAKADDKPMLLDIGAVWCHWCHVIDRESYENSEIAKIINDNFVAVKVDRDERPDVDSRYQSAISSISGQGGWPLTGFLLPDGRPFFGGTYFPPDDQMGRPGFRRVLARRGGIVPQQTRRAGAGRHFAAKRWRKPKYSPALVRV